MPRHLLTLRLALPPEAQRKTYQYKGLASSSNPECVEQYSSGHRRHQTTHLTLQCPTDDEFLARILNQYKADLTKTTPRSTSSSVLVTQTHLTNKMEHMPKSALQAHSLGSCLSGQQSAINHSVTIRPRMAQPTFQTSKLRMNSAVCANEGFSEVGGNCADDVTWESELVLHPRCASIGFVRPAFHRCVLWQKMKLALRTLWRLISNWVCNVGVRQ